MPATGIVMICVTGQHVVVSGRNEEKVYVYVENPADVVENMGQCTRPGCTCGLAVR